MIRVSGPTGAGPAAGPRKAKNAGESFRVDAGPKSASAASSTTSLQPTETLSALIALQSGVTGEGGGRAKTIAAAQRVLDLLDQLRMSVLDGDVADDDLNALALAASLRTDEKDADPALDALIDEIALRARVELAKRGR